MDHENCLECPHSLYGIANLSFNKGEMEGGELHVLNESIKLGSYLPCILLNPVESCFSLCLATYYYFEQNSNLGPDEHLIPPPLLSLILQCVYDLKSSSFLALTGHYRGANQLLRPIIEITLVGRYFEEMYIQAENIDSKEEVNNVMCNFDRWAGNEYTISNGQWKKVYTTADYQYNLFEWLKSKKIWPNALLIRKKRLEFGFVIQWLNKNKCLRKGEIKRLEELQKSLNKYLHPNYHEMDIGNKNSPNMPGTVSYSEEECHRFMELFQDVIDYLIEMVFIYYPFIDRMDETNNALANLKTLEYIEKEKNRPLIISNTLRKSISQIEETNGSANWINPLLRKSRRPKEGNLIILTSSVRP